MISFLFERLKQFSNNVAIIWNGKEYKYSDLSELIETGEQFLLNEKIESGSVVSLNGDFTPNTIALLIALIKNRNIIVPFNYPLKSSDEVKYDIAKVEYEIKVDVITDSYKCLVKGERSNHEYYTEVRNRKSPGIILFSSGTSGKPKGAVHDFGLLLKKFENSRGSLRTINFLLFDHWGGLNTLFHTLANGGVVLALKKRNPEAVCEFIEKYKIELLPVSPSFLNLMILSESYKKFDLSTLKLVTYGTEPMPESTLIRAKELFPDVKFQQTYGLIELGVLRSKSKSDDSLWVKLGGDGYQLRVVDKILQIKAESAMLGYLNAESPFTSDGYFITGDEVEQDGEYYKILGRKSELINVGGDKVYPQEVENIILSMDEVVEVTVFGEKHALMGNIVCANVRVKDGVEEKQIVKEIKKYCKKRTQPFKVPVKIKVVDKELFNERFKKKRNLN